MAKQKSVMIATPMYGGMCTGPYLISVVDTINRFNKLNIPICVQYLMNESLIQRARNEMVRVFLESECTHLMFVDADIEFHYDAIYRLLQADKDVVGGICPKKGINWDLVRLAAKADEEELHKFTGQLVLNFEMGKDRADVDEDGLIKLRSIGTGFMMIKREVFDKLADIVPEYVTSAVRDKETGELLSPKIKEYFGVSIDKEEDHGVLLSEDYHFCQLWRSVGGEIYADPFLSFGHVGTHIFKGDLLSINKYSTK